MPWSRSAGAVDAAHAGIKINVLLINPRSDRMCLPWQGQIVTQSLLVSSSLPTASPGIIYNIFPLSYVPRFGHLVAKITLYRQTVFAVSINGLIRGWWETARSQAKTLIDATCDWGVYQTA